MGEVGAPARRPDGPLAAGALGIGWRREICGVIAGLDGLGFCEVIAESLPRRRRWRPGVVVPDELAALVARGIPAVPHGISLSLGGAEPVETARIEHLVACSRALGRRW